jgi:hypothetical protein
MCFAKYNTKHATPEVKDTDLLEIYILNLAITIGMFVVLIFRAWIELKNYRMMWEELEWRRTYQTMGRVLKAEKDMFSKVEGGEELYQMLLEVFKVNEDQKT